MPVTTAPRVDPTVRVLAAHACAAVALSLPFPALVADLSERSAGPLALGIAGASRMLPYVVLSWFAGALADRYRRDRVVRAGLWARLTCSVAGTVAMAVEAPWAAVVLFTIAVAISLPAYPAIAASLPRLAGPKATRALDVLVTLEVASFVVGGAIGGLLLLPATRPHVGWVAVALTATAISLFRGVLLAGPSSSLRPPLREAYRVVLASRSARGAVLVMCAINFVAAFLALALLPLARDLWQSGAEGYGLSTAVLGLAAFGAPLAGVVGGRTAHGALRRLLPLLALSVLLVLPARSVTHALPALVLVGALSVGAEARATGLLTRAVPDAIRATTLGINDAAIVAAAMVGTLIAPWAIDASSAPLVFAACALVILAPLAVCRERGEAAPIPQVDLTAPSTTVG